MSETNEDQQNVTENGFSNGISSSDEESSTSTTVDTIESVDAPKEEEKTLTDHLNKRLLESFLSRLEEGSFKVPVDTSEESNNQDPQDSFES